MEAKEVYQLSLNHEGVEVLVEVDDLETATNLLNDPVAAQQYVRHLKQNQLTPVLEHDQTELAIAVEEQIPEAQALREEVLTKKSVIWSTKETTKSDQEATILLLELRKKWSNQFADKMTRKAKLWADIAKAIIKKGYNL